MYLFNGRLNYMIAQLAYHHPAGKVGENYRRIYKGRISERKPTISADLAQSYLNMLLLKSLDDK